METYLCQRSNFPSSFGHDRFHLTRNLLQKRPVRSGQSRVRREGQMCTDLASFDFGRLGRCSNAPTNGVTVIVCQQIGDGE